jgi:hypothetical protein
MYCRLKPDELRDKHCTRMLRVEVLESFRSDRWSGAPRNRLIFYAGSIPEHGLSKPDYQFRFWRAVDLRLARLHLAPDIEQRIRDTLLARIPRPASLEEVIERVIKRSRRVSENSGGHFNG